MDEKLSSARDHAPSASSSRAESGAVERVARIIDPDAWITLREVAAKHGLDVDSKPATVVMPHGVDEPITNRRLQREASLAKAEAILTTLDLGELVTALEAADRIVETLARSRRPHGYVIATVLPLDQEIETFLRFRGGVSG